MFRKLTFIFGLVIFLNLLNNRIYSLSLFNCFSIVAGKAATVDGSVYFAHNEDDDQLQHTQGCSQAQVKVLEAHDVGKEGYALCHVSWAAPGDDEHEVKELEGIDEAQKDGQKDERLHQRQGVVAKSLPGRGTIDVGGLIDLAREAL